uniref:Small integral membrane protein 1 n=1 Tax=Kryptolebias marmoratus TaxID=37003 RepID=A0A3Q2ZN45_KRYMA
MDSSGSSNVQYDRWNEDNIHMNVEASQPTARRIYNRVCVGRTGMVVKTAGAIAALVALYFVGYVTGYYVHRC